MASGNAKLTRELIKQVQEAAAAAKDEVLSKKATEALLNLKEEELISADADAEVIKGNAKRPGCWIHSPAMVELFAAADKRLTRVANWAGMSAKQVAKVHARLVKGTKLVLITPAPVEDLTAIPVHRYGSSAVFNLVNLLGEAGLTVATGYRERYDVAYVPKESPAWPALVIDLSQQKERRLEPPGKKESETNS
jgi:hypothetical protein